MTRRTAENRCAKLAEWPLADQDAWAIALHDHDPFEPAVGYARRWKASTLNLVVTGYGRWIGWLERTGQLDPSSKPGERTTLARLTEYREALLAAGLGDLTIANYVQQLGNALTAMVPNEDWSRILRGAGRIRERARRVKNPRQRMRPAAELLQLGFDLMAAAAATADTGRNYVERSADFRDGLIIALLVHRPMRAANIAQIRIGKHLRPSAGGWSVTFSSEEMKAPRAFEFGWPASLVAGLNEYLEVYRPRLLRRVGAEATDALFVSTNGRAFDANRVGERVFLRTRAAFGTPVNAHAFRSIAATTIATETPTNITDAAKVLGHASLRTTRAHYIQAQAIDAGRTMHRALEELRSTARRRGDR